MVRHCVRPDALPIGVPTHHVIVIVEISVANEVPRIRIIGGLDKVIVDLDHGTRVPQLPQLQDFRKIQVKTARGSASIVKSGPSKFQPATH